MSKLVFDLYYIYINSLSDSIKAIENVIEKPYGYNSFDEIICSSSCKFMVTEIVLIICVLFLYTNADFKIQQSIENVYKIADNVPL